MVTSRPVIWLLVLSASLAGCGSPPPAPTFAIAIQNGSDLGLRVNVMVVPDQKPAHSLRIPPGSGILEIDSAPMTVTDNKAVPVVVEIYTDSCDLLDTVSVGSGTTLISIRTDRSVTTSETTPLGGAEAVKPESAPAC